MKFAIRDDDTSYFTKPDDLKNAYDFLKKGCVSLFVVPFTVPVHKDDVFPYGVGIPYGFYDLADNHELVEYLRENSTAWNYDILLHGFSHEYKQVDSIWKAEMMWKTQGQLQEEITKGKHYLEKLFNRPVNVFVAPNNAINQNAISIIEELGMDYSGIIQKNDRRVDVRYLLNLAKRWGYRAAKQIPYPGLLDYGKHKELVAYTLDRYDRLVKEYQECKRRRQPFVVYTHYWQVNQDSKIKELLRKITDFVLNDGAEMVELSRCFEE